MLGRFKGLLGRTELPDPPAAPGDGPGVSAASGGAPPAAPVDRTAPVAADGSASAGAESGELRDAASGRGGGPVGPEIADAFEALFAAELGEAPLPHSHRDHDSLNDATIERIAERVVARLSTGPFGDTISRIVADVSERLVREEIARIRAAGRLRE